MPSFSASTKLGSKAEAFFGVDAKSTSTIQKEGWLHMRPFGKDKAGVGSWLKRYFVLKDSFVFWYKSAPKNGFNKQPQGCLPLGGCGVFPFGIVRGEACFEVTHDEFAGKTLQLKATAREEADDWIRMLNDCRHATWENAILGDALLDKLKYAGTHMEKKHADELAKAQANAMEMEQLRREKDEALATQSALTGATSEQLEEHKVKVTALELRINDKKQRIMRDAKVTMEERMGVCETERRLEECNAAIAKLERAFHRRQRVRSSRMNAIVGGGRGRASTAKKKKKTKLDTADEARVVSGGSAKDSGGGGVEVVGVDGDNEDEDDDNVDGVVDVFARLRDYFDGEQSSARFSSAVTRRYGSETGPVRKSIKEASRRHTGTVDVVTLKQCQTQAHSSVRRRIRAASGWKRRSKMQQSIRFSHPESRRKSTRSKYFVVKNAVESNRELYNGDSDEEFVDMSLADSGKMGKVKNSLGRLVGR